MANEFRKVTDQNGVDHPVCDQTVRDMVPSGASSSNKMATASDLNAKISWADAGKSVKKNLWNTDITKGTANTGITVTHNSDKSITLSGTSTASFNFNKDEKSANKIFNLEAGKSYIFSTQTTNPNIIKQVYVKDTSSSEWRQIAEDTSNPKMTFTMPSSFYDYWIRLRIESGRQVNETFYPMIREATILDDTYAPYIPDNTELMTWTANGVLGAKNILPNTASNDSGNNVSFTVNSDKTITVTTSDTVSAVKTLIVGEVQLPSGNYILNGVTGGSSSTYGFQLYDVTTSTWLTVYSVDGDATITLDGSHKYRIVLFVRNGVAGGLNTLVKPMLRLATDTDPIYQPYAMTNRELTEKALVVKGTLSSIDLNNVTETGLYNLSGSITHSPDSANYGWLEVLKTDANNITQLFHPVGTGGGIYSRRCASGTWQNWYRYVGTEIT